MKWIPIKSKSLQTVPEPVLRAISLLDKQNFRAWLAGGCVRDLVLKKAPKDWDIVTDAPLEILKSLFPQHIAVGAAFGILKLPPQQGVHIDIGIFRKEDGYSDLRHPDRVEIGTLETDMARRDFTINALYLDVIKGQIVDGVGGMADIQKQIIRTVGSADQRFSEDALRILRAARFSAQLGFKISLSTKKAMAKHRGLLRSISRERIREETLKALQSRQPVLYLQICANAGLWDSVFFGDLPSKTPKKSTLRSLEKIKTPQRTPPLAWLTALRATGYSSPLPETLRLSNAEDRVINQCLEFLHACEKSTSTSAPLVFFTLERENPQLLKQVTQLVFLLEPKLNKTSKQAWTKGINRLLKLLPRAQQIKWPQAQQLIKQGMAPGPALGKELLAQSWRLFWEL